MTARPPAAPLASPTPAARSTPSDYVHLPDVADIHFDFDAYAIRPADMKVLDANAQWLQSRADYIVLIEGHCDERGTVEYNLALGQLRAKAPSNYLVSRGVAARRITLVSYGEQRPVCSESIEACRVRNRRAHFKVKRQ
jgi:peptidoglycan-associated lipoprotein